MNQNEYQEKLKDHQAQYKKQVELNLLLNNELIAVKSQNKALEASLESETKRYGEVVDELTLLKQKFECLS